MLSADLAFWKEFAPSLKNGWWNGEGITATNGYWKGDKEAEQKLERLGNRYGRTLHILYALQKIRCPECVEPVTKFRDFWRSLSQLEDRSGLTQMSEACDRVLKPLK